MYTHRHSVSIYVCIPLLLIKNRGFHYIPYPIIIIHKWPARQCHVILPVNEESAGLCSSTQSYCKHRWSFNFNHRHRSGVDIIVHGLLILCRIYTDNVHIIWCLRCLMVFQTILVGLNATQMSISSKLMISCLCCMKPRQDLRMLADHMYSPYYHDSWQPDV